MIKSQTLLGNIYRAIPCPTVQGVQMVAPTAGSRCVIGFRDDSEVSPYIISFVDDGSSTGKYGPSTFVNTGIPKFMV
jgi:hypothetical protein